MPDSSIHIIPKFFDPFLQVWSEILSIHPVGLFHSAVMLPIPTLINNELSNQAIEAKCTVNALKATDHLSLTALASLTEPNPLM